MGQQGKGAASVDGLIRGVGLSRAVMGVVGAACLGLGVAAMIVPKSLVGLLAWILGAVLLASGAAKLFQLVLRRGKEGIQEKSAWFIIATALLDLGLGALIICRRYYSAVLFEIFFGIVFLAEAAIELWMGLRSATVRGRVVLWIAGLATGGIGLAILFRLVPNPMAWMGVFVGLKLAIFGVALLTIALSSRKHDVPLLYEACAFTPVVGELYAVYFRSIFHLGVSIGNNEVVHYLDDNLVHRATWEEFLEGREPQHWNYPDLSPVPAEKVVEVAILEVGKTYPYSLLKFNCEHFAIYCKSGGATHYSKFAQLPKSVGIVEHHPWIGMIAELNTRIVEFLAYQFGGPAGKKLSLAIRSLGAEVNRWLLERAFRKWRRTQESQVPDDPKP